MPSVLVIQATPLSRSTYSTQRKIPHLHHKARCLSCSSWAFLTAVGTLMAKDVCVPVEGFLMYIFLSSLCVCVCVSIFGQLLTATAWTEFWFESETNCYNLLKLVHQWIYYKGSLQCQPSKSNHGCGFHPTPPQFSVCSEIVPHSVTSFKLREKGSCFMVEKVDPNGIFLRQRATTRRVADGCWEPTCTFNWANI